MAWQGVKDMTGNRKARCSIDGLAADHTKNILYMCGIEEECECNTKKDLKSNKKT